MAILQVIPVEDPVVDVSLLPVELTTGAGVVFADDNTVVAALVGVLVLVVSAPVEVPVSEVVVAVPGTVEDDASELCAVVGAVVPADVVAPENG